MQTFLPTSERKKKHFFTRDELGKLKKKKKRLPHPSAIPPFTKRDTTGHGSYAFDLG